MSGELPDLAGGEGEVYLTEWDTDLERMYIALSEVGLAPTDGGGGWYGWERELSQDEYDLVVKAEKLARAVPSTERGEP